MNNLKLTTLVLCLLTATSLCSIASADTNVGGTISTNTTWTLANSPYIVTNSINVGTASSANDPVVVLKIEPGVTVKFNAGTSLYIGYIGKGALDARGTALLPITFTSSAALPVTGSWGKISFTSQTDTSQTFIDNVIVEYAGYNNYPAIELNASISITNSIIRKNKVDGVQINYASATVTNNRIENNGGYGATILYSSTDSSPVLRNNTYLTNGFNAIKIASGVLYRSTTLTKDTVPYVLLNSLNIGTSSSASDPVVVLKIEPGVTVKIGAGNSLYIGYIGKGALDAQGTASLPITFTSAVATPAAGDWGKISFTSQTDTAQTFIDNVIVEYAGYNNYPAIELNAPISITNSIIRKNKVDGVQINYASATVTNNRIENNGGYGAAIVYSSTASSPVLRNNTYVTNGFNAIKIASNILYRSTTLTKDTVPYVFLNSLNIGSSSSASDPVVVLKIEPGVTVKFNAGTSLYIGYISKGALDARGTALLPITFTSSAALPVTGSWGKISFTSQTDTTQTFIDNVIVEYAGYNNYPAIELNAPISITNSIIRKNKVDGVQINYASATVTNNRIENNGGYGAAIVYSSTASSPVLRNNTYVTNGFNAIKIASNILYRSTTLTKDTVPYVFLNSLNIGSSSSASDPVVVLKIEPGVTVKIGAGNSLYVGYIGKGALDARGTAASPIKFTSVSATPAAGDWGKISFTSQASVSQNFFDNVIVEYGGYNNYPGVELNVFTSITNSIIRNNKYDGIYVPAGISPTFQKNQFVNNARYGIYSNNAIFSLGLNSFLNNTSGALSSGTSGSITALVNWWGNATGPSGVGPGTGQLITGNVLFDPWMGEAFNPNIFFNTVNLSPTKFNQAQGKTIFTASFNTSANWQIQIKDSTNVIVKTLTGTGTSINQTWVGDDATNQALPNGAYTYVISATRIAAPIATATVVGKVILDSTIPIAQIASPIPYTLLGNQVQITGTAAGDNFSSYTLEYGVGENPLSWTQISTSATPVSDGVLGACTITNFTNPMARIRLTVKNAENVTAIDSIPVAVLSIYNVADNPDPFSPNGDASKDTTTISANFTYSTTFALSIQSASLATVRSYTGTASSLNFVWDGKNSSGVILPSGVYSYQIMLSKNSTSTVFTGGAISLDITIPTAVISSPIESAVVSGSINVSGTAADANFSSYMLEYGFGAAPTSWTTISSSTAQVSNSILGVWNTFMLANGNYTLRLTVNDTAGNKVQVLRKVTLDNISIANVSANPKFINPAQNQTVTLSFTLDRPANVTVEVYRMGVTIGSLGDGAFFREYQFNLLTDVARPAGINTIVWNGKDAQNQVMSSSAYGYVIKAISGTKSGLYDVPYISGGVSITSPSISSLNLNPYANETVQLNYTLSAPAWVTIGGEYPAVFPAFIVNAKPRPAGVNAENWDGRDGLGNIYQSIDPLTISMKTEILPAVVSVIFNGDLQITSLKTSPYLIFPVYNEVTTITYSVSRTANVTIRVIDPNGSSWILSQINNQLAGNYSYEWKGQSSDGSYLRIPGNYRIEVTAVDPVTNTTVSRSANVSIYK